ENLHQKKVVFEYNFGLPREALMFPHMNRAAEAIAVSVTVSVRFKFIMTPKGPQKLRHLLALEATST
ncbi:unnamed protein product, partial [Brassica oleracea var. botrytis]